jgi:hypothetical protein
MDGYCKLENWGIQIYAAIDAYSRYVIWYYVGISARSAVSVLGQYLSTLSSTGVLPRKLRTDRGAETLMAADSHFSLSQAVRPPIDGTPLSFRDTFRFGTSKQNSFIERWWRQQSFGVMLQWRDCFREYTRLNEYESDWRSDRIAFLAIYMPILRKALDGFVHTWQHHQIRKQPKRPYLVSGKGAIPYLLYHYPERYGGQESGFPLPAELPELNEMHEDLFGLDLDEYLPEQTLQWCGDTLQELGYDRIVDGSATTENGSRVYRLAYLALRDATRDHIQHGCELVLLESGKPWGARKWSMDWKPSECLERVFIDANEEILFERAEDRFENRVNPCLNGVE